jgi:hypothetical protein
MTMVFYLNFVGLLNVWPSRLSIFLVLSFRLFHANGQQTTSAYLGKFTAMVSSYSSI